MRILMLCLGNICRSPLAEGILRNKIGNRNIEVDSAGTNGLHVGELPDPRSIEIAELNNIDITDQRSRKFTTEDFDTFDAIYVMDSGNYNTVMDLARNHKDQYKVELIMNLVSPGMNQNVPDPYYGGTQGFHQVFEMLDYATDKIIEDYDRRNG